jgi:glucose-1-phosphatase
MDKQEMKPSVLYFDLGKVVLSFSHAQMCRQMGDVAGISPDVVRDVLFGDDETQAAQWQYEVGQLSTADYYEYFCVRTGTRPDRARLEHAACDIFRPLEETMALVRRLAAAGHRLAILSNINSLHWQFVSDGRFDVLGGVGQPGRPFGWAVLSYEAGSMKPDERIYRVAVERAGVPAERVFFVDDRIENVEGARALGLDAVLFLDVETLADDLRGREVAGI